VRGSGVEVGVEVEAAVMVEVFEVKDRSDEPG